MTAASESIWKAIWAESPIFLVLYGDLSARDQLMTHVELLVSTKVVTRRTSDPADAFRHLDELVMLAPNNEVEALAQLDGRREQLLARTAPVVLFLLRGGEAVSHLSDHPGLAGWVQGRQVSDIPFSLAELDQERTAFIERHGISPEDWLSRCQAEELPDTLENTLIANHARFLQRTEG
jgi:hypothetical protein